MPQLDGPRSLPMRDPIEEEYLKFLGQQKEKPLKETPVFKELPPLEVENTERMIVIMMVLEDHVEGGDPLMKGDILAKVEDPLTEEGTLIEDLQEEDIPIEMEDPLEEEDTQEEDPLMEMEDPLMVEDLLVMEDPWTSWWTRTTRP